MRKTVIVLPAIEEREAWVIFTRIWAKECRRRREGVSFAQLARAMRQAEGCRYDWKYYITLAAAQCQRFYDEEDMGHMRRLARYQTHGWTFLHDCRGWRAERGGRRTAPFWRLRDLLEELRGIGQGGDAGR